MINLNYHMGIFMDNIQRANRLYEKGFSYFNKGRYWKAIRRFDQSLNLHPKNPKALHALSSCYVKLNDFTLAKKYIEQAIELEPDNEKFKQNLQVINTQPPTKDLFQKQIHVPIEPVKRTPDQQAEHEAQIMRKAGIIVDVGTSGLFGGACVAFGVMFMTMAVIVAFTKLNTAFVYAMIGMIWGFVIGGIPFKIGEWLVKKIEDATWRTRTMQVSAIVGIIVGITQVPHYMEIVGRFY